MTNEEDSSEDLDEIFEDEEKPEDPELVGEDEPKDEEKSEEKSEEESETPPEPTLVPIAALLDERHKRQVLREENEKLKSQIPQTEQKPDMYEDPEGYEAWVLANAEQKVLDKQSAAFADLVESSRSSMLEKHEDYQKIEEVFYILANSDEDLKQEMFRSQDPAQFAYIKGKEYLDAQRENLRAEILAETEDKPPEKPGLIKAPNLASATAQSSNSVEVEKDEDLNDMFEDQVY